MAGSFSWCTVLSNTGMSTLNDPMYVPCTNAAKASTPNCGCLKEQQSAVRMCWARPPVKAVGVSPSAVLAEEARQAGSREHTRPPTVRAGRADSTRLLRHSCPRPALVTPPSMIPHCAAATDNESQRANRALGAVCETHERPSAYVEQRPSGPRQKRGTSHSTEGTRPTRLRSKTLASEASIIVKRVPIASASIPVRAKPTAAHAADDVKITLSQEREAWRVSSTKNTRDVP
mmetsp:Transcript_34423/g.57011  ORF Transcript_34423/g.57011 Transcript_34423/m.57011 type:complete len:232 (-) Transcript_34423:367-1062(-)